MALYDGNIPPAETREPLQALIAAIAPERLLALMRHDSLRPKGFRIDERHLPALQQWLLQRLFGKPTLPEEALRLLAASPELGRRIVALLSEPTLKDFLPVLSAVLGSRRLATALLVDGRPTVRELAGTCLENRDTEPDTATTETALAQLKTLLEPLAHLLSTPAPTDEKEHRPSPQQHPPAHAARRLRALEQRVTVQQKSSENLKDELRKRDSAIERLDQNLKQVIKEREELQAALDDLQSCLRAEIDSQVYRRLQDETYAWLQPLQAVARAAEAQNDAASLTERVRAALQRQADSDRHSANRSVLLKNREVLKELHRRVVEARCEALNPLPELQDLESELSRSIREMDAKLGLQDLAESPPSIIQRLVARINNATADELPGLIDLSQELHEQGVLQAADFQPVRAVISRRRGLLLAKGSTNLLPKDADYNDPLVLLQAALLGQFELYLLIDGHNCLFGLRARYGCLFENNIPGIKARERLAMDLSHLVQGHPAIQTRLVFDGPERSDRQVIPNLTVTFSGGQGENRADRVLIEEVVYLAGQPARHIVVVSNDNEISFRARGLGAHCMTPAELETLLG